MRILHVIHTFPPYTRAGSENYLETLAREQSRRHTVAVLHAISDPRRPEYELTESDLDGLPVARINRTFRDYSRFSDTYRSESVAKAFDSYLGRFAPDVVHFHHIGNLSVDCVDRAKRYGAPVVFTLHDFWLFCARGQLFRRDLTVCHRNSRADCVRCMALRLPVAGGEPRVRDLWGRAERLRRLGLPADIHRRLASVPFRKERAALEEIDARFHGMLEMCDRVDRFVSPSRFLRDRVIELGIPAAKIVVADNGYDLSTSSERRSPAPDGRLRFGFLGTWMPTKGVDLLIRAVAGLDPSQASLDVHGYAVPYEGVEDYEAQLRDLAKGVSHIRLHGRYEPEDVPRLLAEVDVLVVPSRWYENSPLTIHEARLAGVPVVAAGHGGMAEYVEDGVDGLHFRPGSHRSLRRILRQLIENRDLVGRLRRGRRPVVGIADHAEVLEALYREVGVRERSPERRAAAPLRGALLR